MTNKVIIASYKQAQGITESLHTYAAWKSLGYQVRRGEKSKHKFKIWKNVTKHTTDKEGKSVDTNKLFLTDAAFFLESQVEKILSEN